VDFETFSQSPIGQLVPISGYDHRLNQPYDHWAYVPDKLPAEVPLTQPTINVMGQADRALGSLSARIRLLPNPQLLVMPALRKEAKDTSALEGTYAHLDDIFQADYIDPPKRSSEVREVMNYVSAATQAIEMVKSLPICLRLLEPIQKILVTGTRGDGYDAGRLRERQVHIGEELAPVEEARFVPSPPEELVEGFREWERWVNANDEMPLIAKLALAHYQFETLHPFSDGNGRLGRLVITLQLLIAGELEYPILNLSSFFEPRRTEYIDALRNVSITGDFDPWINLFARAVRDRSRTAQTTIDTLLGYRNAIVDLAHTRGVRGISPDVADVVIGNPVVTIAQFAKVRDVAYNTAKSNIEKLVDLGVYREVSGNDYGRLYFAPDVSRIIGEDPQAVSRPSGHR
jgi:Fic family protein